MPRYFKFFPARHFPDLGGNACSGTRSFQVPAETFLRDIDAGLVYGSVGDLVWLDKDGNGLQDPGEDGVERITVQLLDDGGAVRQSVTTGSHGEYRFDGLNTFRTYRVQVVPPQGWQVRFSTFPSEDPADAGKSSQFCVASGQYKDTIDMGLRYGSVGDYVWLDTNANGLSDIGEGPLSGRRVKLLLHDDVTQADTVVQETNTNEKGQYRFDGLDPERLYRLEFVAPYNYVATRLRYGNYPAADNDADPNNDGKTELFCVATGDYDSSFDAGFVPFGSVGDSVWQDVNKNGVQDPGEPGIPWTTVKLLEADDTLVGTTFTDLNGNYRFDFLDPTKEYRVQFVLPSGRTFSPHEAGTNRATDSNADNAGKSELFQVAGGNFKSDVDAGMITTSVGDRVWLDTNGNGLQDLEEPGIADVEVRLYDALWQLVATTTTQPDGYYRFDGLTSDASYTVRVIRPSGYLFSPVVLGNDPLNSDIDPASGYSYSFQVSDGHHKPNIDAGLIEVATHPVNTIVGPGVVPGNSRYNYTLVLDGQVSPTEVQWVYHYSQPVTAGLASSTGVYSAYDQAANKTVLTLDLVFDNRIPAVLVLEAWKGGVMVGSKEILIVKVTVTTPEDAFYFGHPSDNGFSNLANITLVKSISSTTDPGRDGGVEGKATVTLTGPDGNRGVDQLQVGFIQHIHIDQYSGQYAPTGANVPTSLVASTQGHTFLDMGPDPSPVFPTPHVYTRHPWYSRYPVSLFEDATPDNRTKTIKAWDIPAMGVPLTFEQASSVVIGRAMTDGTFNAEFRRLEHISLVWQFDLDVAVQTMDTADGAGDYYFGEARTNWWFNGSGTVGDVTKDFEWKPDKPRGVGGTEVWASLGLSPEDISGPLGNQMFLEDKVIFSPAN